MGLAIRVRLNSLSNFRKFHDFLKTRLPLFMYIAEIWSGSGSFYIVFRSHEVHEQGILFSGWGAIYTQIVRVKEFHLKTLVHAQMICHNPDKLRPTLSSVGNWKFTSYIYTCRPICLYDIKQSVIKYISWALDAIWCHHYQRYSPSRN